MIFRFISKGDILFTWVFEDKMRGLIPDMDVVYDIERYNTGRGFQREAHFLVLVV